MPETCKTCKHWHQAPIDPMNLGAPRSGTCREQPHLMALPVQGPSGQMAVQMQVIYIQTPEGFLACGRHAPREEGVVE